MSKPILIGTRRSALAKTQARWVESQLQARGLSCELVLIESEGDRGEEPLYEVETEAPGLFTKVLEEALLAGKVDVAVHSLKDLPTIQPDGLEVVAVSQRESVSDALVYSEAAQKEGEIPLRERARVGTSSLRREAQMLALRPDLQIIPVRGNVPTRVGLVSEGKLDAVVLAEAGLNRLALRFPSGVNRIALPIARFPPAPGQGALALEMNKPAAKALRGAVAHLDNSAARLETRIERRILHGLQGGCTLPLGVSCSQKNEISLISFLGVYEGMGLGQSARKPTPVHSWRAFHRFDISGTDEETLVAKMIGFYKGVLDAG